MSRLLRRVVLCLLAVWLFPAAGLAQDVIFVVRHAEKLDDSRDPLLSPAGEAHAEALRSLLQGAGLTGIYTSEFKRTIKTAEPLAKAINIQPVSAPASDRILLLRHVRRAHARGRVLIVAHSNTIPDILKGLGCAEAVSIRDNEYGQLFVVIPRPGRKSTLVRLSY